VDNDCDGEVDEFCPVLVHRFDGEDEMDWFGMGVAGAGDVDADGHADWVVSGPMRASGSVFVFSGRDGELLYRWDADEPRDPGAETGWMGISVAAAGDLDADGHGDVLVGGVWDDRPGYAFAFSGADGAALHRFEGESPRDFFGFAVAGVADVNKDDVRDLAIAAPLADPGGLEEAGSVLLFSGRDGVPLRRYDGTHRWEVFGGDVVAPGDLNGDARPELLLRSWEDDPNGPEPTGWVYALSVPGGALLRRFEASNGGSGRGAWLAGAGDVDGDGRPDVVIGEEYGGPGGTATVYSGRDGRLLHRFHGEGTYDLFGWGPTAGCDPNGDGFGDVLVGAPRAGYGAADRGGSVYLFSGADGGALLRLDGEDEDGWLGDRQAAACDADGEGHPQVILGAFGADRGDARQAGAAFVYGFGPCPNG